jgi:hypothetical protein
MDKHKNKRRRDFFFWLCERTLFYMKARKFPQWPWRYRRLQSLLELFLKALPENPFRAAKFFRKLVDQEISSEGYILFVCGPKILRDSLKVCESIGLKPFLVFGTLLGFIRENNFIAHDDDIDLGILDEDFQKKHLIKGAMLKKGYKPRIDDDYLLSFIYPKIPWLFIDFWRVYRRNNHMVIGMLSEEDQKTLFSYYFPIETMCKFRMVNFQCNRVLVPLESEKLLSVTYGEWRIPQKQFDYVYDYKNLKIEKLSA